MAEIHTISGRPGSGKTTYLERNIRRAIEKHGVENILFITLTKAAKAEMASRNLKLPKDNAGTLHSVAYKALGSPTMATDDLKGWNAQVRNPGHKLTPQFAKKSIDDLGMDEADKTEGDSLFSKMNIYRAQMLPKKEWPDYSVRLFAEEWFAWLEENNFMDFTMLIEECLNKILIAPGAPVIIFGDEAQDWSKLEMTLVLQWADHTEKLILAGDPDQTIYDWRGADPNCYITLDVPEANKVYLDRSHRSPETTLNYAVSMIKRIKHREDVEFKPRLVDDQPFKGQLHYLDSVWQDPETLIPLVEKEISQGNSQREGKEFSIMVLASCAYMLNPLIAVLKQRAIPFHNPYRVNNSYWNPLGTIRDSISPIDMFLSFLKPDEDTWGKDAREWDSDGLKLWMSALKSAGVLKRGLKAKMKNPEFKMPDVSNYDEFEALFASPEQAEKAVSLDIDWFQNNVMKNLQKPLEYFVNGFKKHGGKYLRERPKLIIGTIHSVKGGEADTVIIYPDLSRKGFIKAYNSEEGMDSTIRLFFVGLTRTRNKLFLCSSVGARIEW